MRKLKHLFGVALVCLVPAMVFAGEEANAPKRTQNGKKENGFCQGPCCARWRVGIFVAA